MAAEPEAPGTDDDEIVADARAAVAVDDGDDTA